MEKINITEEGFLFGYGIFETIKVIDKVAENLDLHYERLKKSANELEIFLNISFEEFKQIICDEIKKVESKNFIMRFSLIKDGERSKYFINSRKNNYSLEKYEVGFKLKISSVKRNSSSKLTYHKTLNYMENYIELMEAKKFGFDEVIFFNEKGYLCEGAISNIFLMSDDKIYTPRIENGLLPGIKRNELIKKLRNIGENVVESDITYDMLLSATSIFVTNSILGMMKVVEIEDKHYLTNEFENLKRRIKI